MFSKNIFLFITYIIIKNIISQQNSYNDQYDDDDYYADDSSDSYSNFSHVIIAIIIFVVIFGVWVFVCVYSCCRNRNRLNNNARNSAPNNQIVGQPIQIPNNTQQQNVQYYNNNNNNNINGNQNIEFHQNGNNSVENQTLNLNSSNLVLQINYLFQNIMIPEIYSENFGKEEKSCTICLNKFNLNKSKIILTLCHHFFHFYCLKKYLLDGKGKKCPNCNHDFFEIFNLIEIIPSKIKIVPLEEKDNPINEK